MPPESESGHAGSDPGEHRLAPDKATANDEAAEKRRHPRKPVRLSVKLTCGPFSGQEQARDISLGGIFVETTEEIRPGEDIQLLIPFSNQELQIRLKGKVARKTEDGIGVEFDIYSIDIE
ncbi:MAG: PilZ domain-containing protein [Desulfosudaceae bacterium]